MIKWHSDFEDESDKLDIKDDEREQASNLIKEMVNLRDLQKKEESFQQYPTDIVANLRNTTIDVTKYAFEVLKESINSTQNAFRNISRMSYIIFGVGISLFTLSAISGLLTNQATDSVIFGALGVVSFVAFFILGPTSYVQKALSNLLQAEIIYMNFWDQIHFWAPYGVSTDIQEKREGSEKLQALTEKILKMLEDYIEKDGKQDWRDLLHIK